MKFAEIRLHDSAPDASGSQTHSFRDVDADVEPWGLWVGSLLLPWGSIRYARAGASVTLANPADAGKFEVRRMEVPTSAVITGVDVEAGAVTMGVSPHDVEKLPPISASARRGLEEQGAPPEAYEREAQRMAEQRRKRERKPAP